ncbi:MAG TPA: CofH family radical SAM protein [Bacteroidales bacterium]|nr:CofH family radical SAM protein [Bacteroidales bacterium]HSA42876.1 CofH family radical SAM protein [Bacteroidales bacterium]
MNPMISGWIDALELSDSLSHVVGKVVNHHRISTDDALLLYREADPGLLGVLASLVCQKKNDDKVFYIRNFHIEPTNICIHHCAFCSYSSRHTGHAWDYSVQEMLGQVRELAPNIRELHIVGGVHPGRDVTHYAGLLREIKQLRPDLYLKAFSAIELDYMIKTAGMDYRRGLELLRSSGLDGIPGGGAEIFDESLRKQICPDKTSSADWLLIHRTAHQLGIPTNATILYGHLETYAHRVDHLNRLRELQDETHGFSTFIPLKYRKMNNPMGEIGEVGVTEDMKNYAVSRIFLDNFPHIKAYWPMLGKEMAALSLSFGVDDLDGTIQDSTKIYSLAGSEEQHPAMTAEEMEALITAAGKMPVERDGWYHPA